MDGGNTIITNEQTRRLMSKVPAWVVGIVFVYSASIKIYSPYSFLAIIYGYEIVSPSQGLLIASTLPWVELTLGMLLLSQSFLRAAWLLVTAMLAVFVVARIMVISSGLSIPCGCYGMNGDIVNWQNTSVTMALLIISAMSLYLSKNQCSCQQDV